ncbi:hypothetical protein ATANTOWER_023564 [Ataeniobius toweri]|uniref:Uncharacterized protein n=1 Tax=Ataeniobius toweri TaxID=208326 RepID=A0ABU7BUE8_9TELE|nr:hypothetical protein [Ataeniobius toweri]
MDRLVSWTRLLLTGSALLLLLQQHMLQKANILGIRPVQRLYPLLLSQAFLMWFSIVLEENDGRPWKRCGTEDTRCFSKISAGCFCISAAIREKEMIQAHSMMEPPTIRACLLGLVPDNRLDAPFPVNTWRTDASDPCSHWVVVRPRQADSSSEVNVRFLLCSVKSVKLTLDYRAGQRFFKVLSAGDGSWFWMQNFLETRDH